MLLENLEQLPITIINLTPHPVNLLDVNANVVITFHTEGLARCSQNDVIIGKLNKDIILTKTSYGEIIGLPEQSPRTFYIVSRLVRNALPNRTDLLVPNQLIRDSEGQIVGCRSFSIQ